MLTNSAGPIEPVMILINRVSPKSNSICPMMYKANRTITHRTIAFFISSHPSLKIIILQAAEQTVFLLTVLINLRRLSCSMIDVSTMYLLNSIMSGNTQKNPTAQAGGVIFCPQSISALTLHEILNIVSKIKRHRKKLLINRRHLH